MSDFEFYTIASGLNVRAQRQAARHSPRNRLYEIQSGNDDTGLKSNTDSKVLPATWHLSIDKDGNLFDPWTLWKYVGFELSDVEVVTGKKGAKPWMLSFRRRGAKFVKEEQAAEDNYKQRVSFAKRLMQGFCNKLRWCWTSSKDKNFECSLTCFELLGLQHWKVRQSTKNSGQSQPSSQHSSSQAHGPGAEKRAWTKRFLKR